jgi:thiamine-phosphate pyrophosphorylase
MEAAASTSDSLPPPGDSAVPLRLRVLGEPIRRAIAAGVDWIQIREKDLVGGALVELARFAVADARTGSAEILINDRLDVALAAGAAGVHLGEQSLPLGRVVEWRRSAGRNDFRIGVSCHSLESGREAERCGADYLFFGPVYATPSKAAFGAPQGIERLREVCSAVKIPVLAIGGITSENARACLEAGAAGVAAIRLFQDSKNREEISAAIEALRRASGTG